MMRSRSWAWVLRLNCATAGLAAAVAGCGEEAPLGGGQPGAATGQNEDITEVHGAFTDNFSFSGCGTSQQQAILPPNGFGQTLQNVIYGNGGANMRACLNDTFLSYVNATEWGGELATEFQRNVTTTINCVSNVDSTCAGTHNFSGCASVGISGENVTLANQLILDPFQSNASKAGVLAHELAHNYGHSHPNFGDGDTEYDFTVTQRARSCVQNNNTLPINGGSGVAESRTRGMPGEVELGYIGRFGGTPFEFAGTGSQFVSGINSWANQTMNGLEIKFTDASGLQSAMPLVGGTASSFHNTNRLCPAGSVVTGIWGSAGSTLNQLSFRCAPRSNINGGPFTDMGPDGNPGPTAFQTMCPSGKAVRQIRGRASGTINQIQIVCDDVNKSFSPDHAPHKVGTMLGSASGVLFQLRCSGNGGLSSLEGRADTNVIQRLGALCRATGGTLPVTPTSWTHPASPWLGGHGGTAFHNACASNEMMVGVNVRSAGNINSVGAICAPAVDWDNGASGAHDLGSVGGGTGTLTRQMCPNFQFVVGLNLWGGSVVNGLQVVCADMR